ncbi:MAG: hypothetical protein KUA43_09215 [Hoeflea sp.]|uniref:hypothetical protein n=1 Tax=Hoeflea sp. TaxID=1940281 RepID=UPI001D57B27B|nr:hypothetical protein [Hoeflea sp.]MBU4528353.1 hypothetical protein [Alphaproteobacteria bacterium]MBU4543022.1 hypothetical protein [Alphaproteobacteria bacterium]MBU4551713.1 hypothetical protein [Alphaproteobacteria bacterium]MBV1723608.1 hypothetical protein [Hoeflea sp.]MBV1761924.1 hypothetical protein [Hoeflea sp.]
MFFLQTLFFVAVAFGLGCLCGCWLKGRFGRPHPHSGAAGAITHEGAARTATAGELASSWPHYEPATSLQPIAALTPKPAAEAKPEPDAKSSVSIATAPAAATEAPASKAAKPKAGKPAAKPAAKPASDKPSARKSAAAAKPASSKAAKPKAAKAKSEAAAVADNLKQIKGVGPQIEAKLNAAGINSFAQIAAWTKKEQADFGEQLSFAGRIEREDWVAQARILAKGGSTDFAKRVAKGEVASSAGGKSKPGKK